MAKSVHSPPSQIGLRPLPLLDTLRRGTWEGYARQAAAILRGEVLTAVNKRKGFVQAHIVRFGPRPETGRFCELGFFIFDTEVRYFDGKDDDPLVLKHVKDARTVDDRFEVLTEYDGVRCALTIGPNGDAEFRVTP